MLLGLDTFSLRWQGWDAFQMIDYAASLGLENVHFSERANLESHEEDYLRRLKTYADERGLRIELGMRSFDRFAGTFDASLGSGEQQLTDMIRAAQIVGSPVVRCFLGMQSDRVGQTSVADHIAEAVRVMKAVAPVAEAADITIAIENHGGVDLLARELRGLIEEVNSTHVGVCLDTGNPLYGGEDAVFATEILAPYIVTAHFRDTRVWRTPSGCAVQWAPCGEGDVDLVRIAEILSEHKPGIALDLEIITGGGAKEIDFLNPESEFWRCYPDMPAQDFARFLALLDGGSNGPLEQRVPGHWPPDTEAELEEFRAQQRRHMETSITWCREHLNLAS